MEQKKAMARCVLHGPYDRPTCPRCMKEETPSDALLQAMEQARSQHIDAPTLKAYDSLYNVLREAFDQASMGKGNERHAQGQPFDQQPMQKIIQLYGVGFALGQAAKKMQESQRMTPGAAKHELLGAINYIAGAIIHIEKEQRRV